MRVLTPLLIVFVVAGCTVLKPDPATRVNDFLSVFQDQLNDATDREGILSLFNSQQGKDPIMAAVNVLRNTEYPAVFCTTYFGQAVILTDSAGLRVEIPALLSVDTLGVKEEYQTQFTMWLKESKESYLVSRLDAEDFYNTFLTIKGQASWVLDEQETLEEHREYFRIASRLSEKFDTVAFLAVYNGNQYYYVATSNWDIDAKNESKMGIVDSTGREIVPMEYLSIGNPGLVGDDIVEVNKATRIGYFNIATKKVVIQPEYEWIIPYKKGNVYALAKNDTIGWINRSYQFTPGFPDAEAKEFYTSFSYVPEEVEYSATTQTLLESPFENSYGSGVLFVPSYLTHILQQKYDNFSMDGRAYRAYVESVKAERSFFGAVTDHFNAFMTTITSRYLEGREEFYSSNEVTFVDGSGAMIASFNVASSDISIRKIDSTLLEVRANWEFSPVDYGVDPFDEELERDLDVPNYSYYLMINGNVERLESSRTYSFTEFVKLDSSYLTGKFTYYDKSDFSEREFLGVTTLQAMRNEILAVNGYTFTDPKTIEELTDKKIYNPVHKSFEELEPGLSEIDRHNLKFLERILGPINSDPGT